MLKKSSNITQFGVSHVLALAVSVACVSGASAQVETRESTGEPVIQQPTTMGSPMVRPVQGLNQVSAQPATSAGDLFFEVQQLRQEMMQLRGLVEEQAYEIKRLKQQRIDDYTDLDRRVAALTLAKGQSTQPQASVVDEPAQGLGSPQPSVDAGMPQRGDQPVEADPAAERTAYRAAFGLLTSRQMPEALVAFEQLLAKYPSGQYAANAYYWMGEIYGYQGDTVNAKAQYRVLISQFGDDRKTVDGRFKLGKLLFAEGDRDGAREQLDIVAASNTETANLAKAFIRDNL